MIRIMIKLFCEAVFLFMLISCNNTASVRSIDTSSFGNINMIKEIDGQVYVLNATTSSVHLLKDGKLELFIDLRVKGRDFLQDFDIEDDTLYYSNTYDEIFISSGSVIEDTLKVKNPDRIAVLENQVYVTSRKAEEGFYYMKKIDPDTNMILKTIQLNDEPLHGLMQEDYGLFRYKDSLAVYNPVRKRIEKYDKELELRYTVGFKDDLEYGNLYISDDLIRILCVKDDNISVLEIQSDGRRSMFDTGIQSENIDIGSSCLTNSAVYLYDYIDGRIIIRDLK